MFGVAPLWLVPNVSSAPIPPRHNPPLTVVSFQVVSVTRTPSIHHAAIDPQPTPTF